MLLFVIKIKNDLNKIYLNRYITRFLKLPFGTRYIKIQLKLKTVDGQTYSIGNHFYIDFNNPRTISSYKLMIIDSYDKFVSSPKLMPVKFYHIRI